MKCPKCGYLGYEAVDRCRNCGYDFSLSQGGTLPELALRRGAPEVAPLDDLALVDRAAPPAANAPGSSSHASPDALSSFEPELPLFGGPITDDVPLITKPSPPRQPLAVRRATPEIPRLRPEPARSPMLDLDLDAFPPADTLESAPLVQHPPDEVSDAAALASRVVAVAIDLAVLAVVDVIVVYFTMQICGLTVVDAALLPKGPLLAFLLVQNGGYLVAFTAGGQTLGKMAAGIRVVAAREGDSVDIGRAVMRTVMWLVLAVPAGLGFLSALFSRDHRGLHDRFSGTRVVRAV